jgi:hypothetical protein
LNSRRYRERFRREKLRIKMIIVHKYGTAELNSVCVFFEGIGILLKRKLIDIELVDDMFTSPIKRTWEKVKDITLEARKVRDEPEMFEWFEYLYNKIKKRERSM